MKIIERYTVGMRIYRGRGLWRFLVPLRALLASVYGMFLLVGRGSDRRKRRDTGRIVTGTERRAVKNGLRSRIVSIGNIETGGGGKTPLAILLAESIAGDGGQPVVVTRGYRGAAERSGKPVVVAAPGVYSGRSAVGYTAADELVSCETTGGYTGRLRVSAHVLGDEVVLYRIRGIPVVVDRDRRRGIACARSLFRPTHILLDDAFRHRLGEKDLDILLLDASRPFGDGRLVPLGTLREGPSAVRRADVVVFTRATGAIVPQEARPLVAGKQVFFARHRPVGIMGRTAGEELSTGHLAGRKFVLYSGIARPESFEACALELGAEAACAYRFVDHHPYREADIERMLAEVGSGAPFLTTEKDWVKSAALFPGDIEVYALRIGMEIEDMDRLLDIVSGR